ncbi:MAG: arsenate reductase (glutaredoxin), partial [Actinomycetales bacterium]
MAETTTVLHNPACSTSRHALEAAAEAGLDVEVLPYL